MSRIGKLPIEFNDNITVSVEGSVIKVSGPKGELSLDTRDNVKLRIEDKKIFLDKRSNLSQDDAYQGLYRALINNMVIGVSEGFSKELEIRGIGYRVALENGNLVLNVGFSHSVTVQKVEGIEFEIIENNFIKVSGIDKQLVGQVAANIRSIRKPEPYKGKGIRYKDEEVIKKAGKSAKVAK